MKILVIIGVILLLLFFGLPDLPEYFLFLPRSTGGGVTEELINRTDLNFHVMKHNNSSDDFITGCLRKNSTNFESFDRNKRKIYLLFFHGNAGNIYTRAERSLNKFPPEYNIFVIDYRGYGSSSGVCSIKNTYEDAILAWNYMIRTLGINSRDIFIYGESVGGGVSAFLANYLVSRNVQIGGLILQSTFSSFEDIVKDLTFGLYPTPESEYCVKYETHKHLENIKDKTKILIIHGKDDNLVKVKHAEKNYSVISSNRRNKLLIVGGDHNHIERDAYFYQQFREFVC